MPTKDTKRKICIWVLILLSAAALLYGRFDWKIDPPASRRAYLPLLFFFCLFLPTLFHILQKLIPHGRVSYVVTAVTGVWYALPYHWLGLEPFFMSAGGFISQYGSAGIPKPQWYPEAFGAADFPFQGLFFGTVGLLGLGLLGWYFQQKRTVTKRERFFFGGLFLLILCQLLGHLSYHSPYTYLPHYEMASEKNYWYIVYLFPGGGGAVNADYPWYRQCEEALLGISGVPHAFWTRMFPIFLAVPWTRFFNPYYVWLCINIAAWCGAVAALYYIACRWFDKTTARFTAVLAASAPGFILYGAQPAIYVLALAALPVMLALFFKIFDGGIKVSHCLLFGSVLGLFSLTYESQPWLLTIPLLGLLSFRSWRGPLLSVAIAILIYVAFSALGKTLPDLVLHPTLQPGAGNPIQNTLVLFLSGDLPRIFTTLRKCFTGWKTFLDHAFPFCVFPALLGLLVTPSRRLRLFLLTLVLPSFLTYSVMCLGQQDYYLHYPRIVYSAYPAIYMSCAFSLAWVSRVVRPRFFPQLGFGLAVLCLLAHIAYWNSDVFGHPGIYWRWFYLESSIFT